MNGTVGEVLSAFIIALCSKQHFINEWYETKQFYSLGDTCIFVT